MATLAALAHGDSLSFGRLQDVIGLTAGNLLIHLRKLDEADYISSTKAHDGSASITTVALTDFARTALANYLMALRKTPGWHLGSEVLVHGR